MYYLRPRFYHDLQTIYWKSFAGNLPDWKFDHVVLMNQLFSDTKFFFTHKFPLHNSLALRHTSLPLFPSWLVCYYHSPVIIRRIGLCMIRRGKYGHFMSVNSVTSKEVFYFLRNNRRRMFISPYVAEFTKHSKWTTCLDLSKTTKYGQFFICHTHVSLSKWKRLVGHLILILKEKYFQSKTTFRCLP